MWSVQETCGAGQADGGAVLFHKGRWKRRVQPRSGPGWAGTWVYKETDKVKRK